MKFLGDPSESADMSDPDETPDGVDSGLDGHLEPNQGSSSTLMKQDAVNYQPGVNQFSKDSIVNAFSQ